MSPIDLKSRPVSSMFLAEIIIYLNVAWLLVADYVSQLTEFTGMQQDIWFSPGNFVEMIARGNGIDPYRGRILVPMIVIGTGRMDDSTFDLLTLAQIQWAVYFVSLVLLLVATRMMLDAFGFGKGASIAGALLVAGLLPVALRDHGYQAWSWFEALTIPLAITLSIRRGAIWKFLVLAGVAALNRETAILLPLIPLAFALSSWKSEKCGKLLTMALSSFLIVALIRAFLSFVWPGPASEREISLEAIRNLNLQETNLWTAAAQTTILLGGLAGCAAIALWRGRAPREAVWVAGVTVPFFTAVWLYFALWWEVRVLIPVVLVILPVALSAIFPLAKSRR